MLSPTGNLVLALGGTAVVLATLLDLVWTTMSLHRAGPVTRVVLLGAWTGLRWFSACFGGRRVLIPAGPTLLFASLAGWILLLWIGWGMIFMAGPDGVLTTPDRDPADFSDRVYFTGFTISTLGVGDVIPKDGLWQVLTALAALNGLIAITVGITYVLSVLNAAVQMRQLARYITSLGGTAEEMLVRGWTGRDFAPLMAHLHSLTPQLLTVGQQHFAYPILRYFSSAHPVTAIAPAVAVLDEAVTLLESAVAPELRPLPLSLRPIRTGIAGLIDDMSPAGPEPADERPPAPDLDVLRDAGIAVVSYDRFAEALEREEERRRRLHRILQHEGWEWGPVTGDGGPRIPR